MIQIITIIISAFIVIAVGGFFVMGVQRLMWWIGNKLFNRD